MCLHVPFIMKSTEVKTRSRVGGRMRRATGWWAGFGFGCCSWSLAGSRGVWRGLAALLGGMRGAVRALRCVFWCLRGARGTLVDHAVVGRCVFACWLFRALALQRSVFGEGRS